MPLTFQVLLARLVANLRERVRRGEISERRLAQVTGVSQPHLHNVLKDKSGLSVAMADQILHHLRQDLVDLIEPDEIPKNRDPGGP